MSKFQGKGARFGGAGAFSSPARGFGGFSSQSTSSGLSYLVEPPDLSSISDANVVVSFKNLLKKDATTKTKALEELVAYVQAHPFEQEGGTEEAILEAWVQVYPRTSIDNARRVRELSHTLQFELVKSARKRMEKRIPRVVGTWLAGLYDKDRGVSRAADQGLSSFLSSPDKVVMFWTKCQSQILAYATEAIQETQETLSDERSTTPDDAEAKYYRVVGASLSLVLGLLQKVDNADVEKEIESYDAFFGEEKVWKSIIFGDATVKKAACQLLWVCLEKREAAISAQTSRLKKIFITEGLKSSQTGSAIEYVRVLTRLTQKFPEIWSSSSDKKTPVSRLGGFLERGSQASSVKYWEYLEQLLVAVPRKHISPETATNTLKSLRVGITGREEPRMHAPTAWTSYVRITRHFISALPADETRAQFVRENLFPLTSHYLNPTPETSAWDIGGNGKLPVLVEAFQTSADRHHEDTIQATADEWTRLAEEFCARIASSLPEVSKDYQKSQDAIAEQSTRWFTLVGQIHSKTTASHQKLPPIIETSSTTVIARAIQLLSSRNVKPFGAAALLASVGKHAPHLWEDPTAVADFWDFLFETGKNRMQLVLDSRSLTYLARCVADLGAVAGQQNAFKEVWTVWIGALLGLKNHEQTRGAIRSLVSHDAAAPLATSLPDLQEYLVSQAEQHLGGDDDALPILEAAATHNTLTDASAKEVVDGALDTLRQDPKKSARVLAVVGIIVTSKPQVVSQNETHMALVTALLGLTELSDTDISSRAVSLRALIDNGVDGKVAGVSIIQKNLEDAGVQSLSIETLYQQALQAVKSDGVAVTDLFPDTNLWKEQLQSLLEKDVNPSLSITNKLEGATSLVQASEPESGRLPRLGRDRDGCVAPLRMALYIGKLLSSDLDLESLPQDFKVEVLFLLSITVQLATDQMTLEDENKLWSNLGTADSLESAAKFVSTSRSIILDFVEAAFGWRDGTGEGSTPLIETLIAVMIQQSMALTPMGLYSARALSDLIEGLNDKHGIPLDSEAKLAKYDTLKATPSTVLAAVALLRGYGEMLEPSKLTNTLCNRLVSDIAGLSVSSNKTLATLVLFNACAQVYELGEIPVPNNRLVFAIRQVTSWLEDPVALTPQLSAEVCRALQRLLPCINEVYGPHWERTIDFCTNLWVKASEDELDVVLPYIHASIKLMNTLETISEPNDDLDDALKEAEETLTLSLLELLKLPREKNTQPLEITDALICRRVGKLSLTYVYDELSELYGLMASDSRDIQSAAFSLLHRALPAVQAKLSIDVLLDKTDARLPDELLSLLLDAPTLEKYPDEVLAKFPTPIRSYLLTWCLIFDAYSTASQKVRTDYTEHLKTENYVGPLMDFMFDVLGHSASHPLNLEREGLTSDHIQSYDLRNADSEPEERNLHWLLIHVFYLTLKYIPGLFKAWFMDCRSKQTTNAVKDWLIKHFSPIIVSELLDEVAQWAKDQEEPADDEKELVVKVSQAAKEITAGYEVDESLASISIRVPPGYPIDIVTVAGLNRVAVNERKWNSWLMTTQGVITFSNGSIIDGLTTFRRNIVGALKGQSECAICYSIISTDKKMPDKKCSTCKNLFHRTCLYKWFQSSNQNTCPLCRNPIDYIGADTKPRRAAVA